jgi:hypothetical protein
MARAVAPSITKYSAVSSSLPFALIEKFIEFIGVELNITGKIQYSNNYNIKIEKSQEELNKVGGRIFVGRCCLLIIQNIF